MRVVLKSYGRAMLMQFNIRMVLLSFLPSLLALGLWALVLYHCLQPLIDFLQANFVSSSGFQLVGNVLTFFGLIALKAFIVPLVAMWLLLPLMLFSALIFVACIAMPAINSTISRRYFPLLEKKAGAGWWKSLGFALLNLIIFILVWSCSLPVSMLINAGVIVQPILIGWITYRVIAFDALAAHADSAERKVIMSKHRWQLWAVGIITGLISTLPGLVWLGGVLWIVVLPLFAAFAIWLYVLVFMFSGIWFQLYCLETLQQLRSTEIVPLTGEK